MIEFNDLKGISPESNPLHGSNGGEMLAPLIRQIPIDHIQPDPQQPRRQVRGNGPAWEGLVESVRSHGVLQPILVRRHPAIEKQYMIICGERRWRAAREAGLSHIAARVVKAPEMLARAAQFQLAENALREGISPLDEMEACVRLAREDGMTQLEIGRLLGIGRSAINDIFKLDRIAPAVRDELRRRDLRYSRRQLLKVAAAETPERQMAVLRRLCDGNDAEDEHVPEESVAPDSGSTPDEGIQGAQGTASGPSEAACLTEDPGYLCLECASGSMASGDHTTMAKLLRRMADRLEFDVLIQRLLDPRLDDGMSGRFDTHGDNVYVQPPSGVPDNTHVQ